MKYRSLTYWFSLLLLILTNIGIGQVSAIEVPSEYEKDYSKARQFFYGYQNDSALVLWDDIIDRLEMKMADSEFFLEVKLRKAQSLEKAEMNEEALSLLIEVEKKAEIDNHPGILIESHIDQARLHEKINNEKSCLFHLEKARELIELNALPQYSPRLSVRFASYQRLYGGRDSALIFAREAVNSAKVHGAQEEEAAGNLLMGMLNREQNINKAIKHFQRAGEIWNETENYVGYCAVYTNISSLLRKNDRLEEALLFNDTALYISNNLKELGIIKPWPQSVNFLDRAKILKGMGKVDSAWHYMTIGNDLRVDEVYRTNHSKVLEIDAFYQNELKDQELTKKNQIIEFEKKRNYGLISGLTVLLILIAVLTYLYFKLRSANRKISRQASIIQTANNELQESLNVQLLLKSELHHRVKNNLQTVISILELQGEEVEDAKLQSVLENTTNRIFSIAAIHDLAMQEDENNTVPFKDFVQKLCSYYQDLMDNEKVFFTINIPDIHFSIKSMMPLGLIINELVTNALKHAIKKSDPLKIEISLEGKEEESWRLTISDNGPGFQENKGEKTGLGFHLIESMVQQLEGELTRSNNGGAITSIRI